MKKVLVEMWKNRKEFMTIEFMIGAELVGLLYLLINTIHHLFAGNFILSLTYVILFVAVFYLLIRDYKEFKNDNSK